MIITAGYFEHLDATVHKVDSEVVYLYDTFVLHDCVNDVYEEIDVTAADYVH